MLSLLAALPPSPRAACAALNFSAKVEMMHGFGEPLYHFSRK
jgi:hypothetical protein